MSSVLCSSSLVYLITECGWYFIFFFLSFVRLCFFPPAFVYVHITCAQWKTGTQIAAPRYYNNIYRRRRRRAPKRKSHVGTILYNIYSFARYRSNPSSSCNHFSSVQSLYLCICFNKVIYIYIHTFRRIHIVFYTRLNKWSVCRCTLLLMSFFPRISYIRIRCFFL